MDSLDMCLFYLKLVDSSYRVRMHAVEQAEGFGVREYALIFNVGANFTDGREDVRLDASEGGGIPNIHGHVHSFVYYVTLEFLY